jgi:hypothetical protein
VASNVSPIEQVEQAEKLVQAKLPRPVSVPDWSPMTIGRLAVLKPVEYAFVHWRAAGYSAAESYRRAAGLSDDETHHAAVYAHRMGERDKVAAALASMLKDRNFSARMDREWLLQKLMTQIEACEEAADPKIRRMMPQLLLLAARMTGQIVEEHKHKVEVTDASKPGDISQRVDRLIKAAERHLGIRQVRDAENLEVRAIADTPAKVGPE